jgi:hypothetical protein
MPLTFPQPLALLIGLALCCFGWTLYWAGIKLSGAVIGLLFGASGSLGVALIFALEEYAVWMILCGAVIGMLLGIFLFKRLHVIFFFFVGACLGILGGEFLTRYLVQQQVETFQSLGAQILLKAVTGLLTAIIVARLSRYAIITITALVGTLFILSSWDYHHVQLLFLPIFLTSLALQTGLLKVGKIEKRLEQAEAEEEQQTPRHPRQRKTRK